MSNINCNIFIGECVGGLFLEVAPAKFRSTFLCYLFVIRLLSF